MEAEDLDVLHRVLDVFVAEPVLDPHDVVCLLKKVHRPGVFQHVKMPLVEGDACLLPVLTHEEV